jgi:N-acetylmuramoyl-L-alanine amidase
MGHDPDWSRLDVYQRCLTRDDFLSQLAQRFAPGDAWKPWIEIGENVAWFRTETANAHHFYRFEFAPDVYSKVALPSTWRDRDRMAAPSAEKPLRDVHIALDPGHLGGSWAQMEGRSFRIGNGPVFCEGDFVLEVAQVLVTRLSALGARVSLVRDVPDPVTCARADQFLGLAKQRLQSSGQGILSEEQVRREAEALFYRNSEIRARAEKVNDLIRPDVVIALHVNAGEWKAPGVFEPIDTSHFHLLVSGAFSADELSFDDVRLDMLECLLSGAGDEEIKVGESLANSFRDTTGLEPFLYSGTRAVSVTENPYIWARNLLANRLYQCPVVYLEPWVANSYGFYPRYQRDVEGLSSGRTLVQEYVEAVTQGLVRYYGSGE